MKLGRNWEGIGKELGLGQWDFGTGQRRKLELGTETELELEIGTWPEKNRFQF